LEIGFRSIKNSFSHFDAGIVFPSYNGKKNLGYETQRMIHEYYHGHREIPSGQYHYTSVDLLKIYHRTGDRIGGPLEVRSKWSFSLIKPRVYYSLGGDGFWEGLYAQPIANAMVKLLPSTHPFSRFDVQRLGSLKDDEILVTYDYESFTTTLGELKHFMFHLANEFVGTPMTVLDVHEGLQDLDLGEYLHTYNEAVNHLQEFDLSRFFPGEENNVFHQGRSGSLGTKGNIVFSMFLHGVVLGTATGTPDDESVVGDDALTKILRAYFQILLPVVNALGRINTDKYTTLSRPPTNDVTLANRQGYKYLKRPITVDFEGKIKTGTLDSFPGVADLLFPEGDGIHASHHFQDPFGSIKTFCVQWGRFLTEHFRERSSSFALADDLEVVLHAVQVVYDKYGVDREGGVPGDFNMRIEDGKGRIERRSNTFFVPPCDDRFVFDKDWIEDLYARRANAKFIEPVRVGGIILPDLDAQEGSRFDVTLDHPLVSLLVALDCVTVDKYMCEATFDRMYAERLKQRVAMDVEPESILASCTVISLPIWYLDVMLQLVPNASLRDPLERLDGITSLFSGSNIV